jgi:hypothetical protein
MRKTLSFIVLFSLLSLAVPQSHSQQPKSEAQKSSKEKQKATPPNQANMLRGRQSLEVAKNELIQAGGEWGGHRMGAINHIDEALKEIQKAEAYAREHHEIK